MALEFPVPLCVEMYNLLDNGVLGHTPGTIAGMNVIFSSYEMGTFKLFNTPVWHPLAGAMVNSYAVLLRLTIHPRAYLFQGMPWSPLILFVILILSGFLLNPIDMKLT